MNGTEITLTSLGLNMRPWWPDESREVSVPEPKHLGFLEDCGSWSDVDFVLGLAYAALEHEANAATSEAARVQIGYLLDRLQRLDFRE